MFISIKQFLFICFALLKAVICEPQLHKALDHREYLIETEHKYNWYEAWNECARKDLQLVIIDSEGKNAAIIEMLKHVKGKPLDLWLGANDEYNNRKDCNRPFFWSGTGNQSTFNFWSDNNPDNSRNSEHCIHIWGSSYQWNDNKCTEKMGFICEENHYSETYNKDIKRQCDAAKQLKTELKQEENVTRPIIKEFLDHQESQLKKFSEQVMQHVKNIMTDFKKSTDDIHEFSLHINEKLNNINIDC